MRTKQTVSFQADETGGSRVGQAAAGGAGLDDLAVEGEAVDDRGAESRVGEGLRPAGERFVGGDRDGRLLLPFGQYLKQQLSPAAVQLEVSKLVADQEIEAAVASDGLGELLFVGGFDELVDQLRRENVADGVSGLGGGSPEGDEQWVLPVPVVRGTRRCLGR